MIKNIIFDWSGVINDNMEIFHLTVLEMFKKYNVPPINFEELRVAWVQPYMQFYNKYIPEATIEEEKELYKKIYGDIRATHPPRPFPGMIGLVKKIKNNNKRSIIISCDPAEHLHKEIADYGIADFFSEVNSDVYDKLDDLLDTIHRNGFNPEETIFLGDTVHEVECGKSVGVLTGAVTWGIHKREQLVQADPDHIVDTVEELEKILLRE